MSDATRCIRCLLRDISRKDYARIEEYMAAIRPEDRVDSKAYEDRLDICKECDKLNQGTCNACGCYVELRALGISSNCPYKKW